jgi:hypothetical protein
MIKIHGWQGVPSPQPNASPPGDSSMARVSTLKSFAASLRGLAPSFARFRGEMYPAPTRLTLPALAVIVVEEDLLVSLSGLAFLSAFPGLDLSHHDCKIRPPARRPPTDRQNAPGVMRAADTAVGV